MASRKFPLKWRIAMLNREMRRTEKYISILTNYDYYEEAVINHGCGVCDRIHL